MEYFYTSEQKQILAPDVQEPTKDFHDNWYLIYLKLLETRKENIKLKLQEHNIINVDIDKLVEECLLLQMSLPFIEYNPHTNDMMFKSLTYITEYNQDKIVLCSRKEGFIKAITLAIEFANKRDKK